MNNDKVTSKETGEAVEKVEDGSTVVPSSEDSVYGVDGFRSTLAQCFATYVNSLSYMSLGLMYTISSVVVPTVLNAKSGLSLDDEQTSWYVALLPLFQPVGCVIGGFLQNYIGRKQGLLLMNVSTVTAWILLYEANNVVMLYVSSSMMGVSIGFAEAPSVTYVCEITTPKLRGTLVTYNNANVIFGMMFMYLLSYLMSWRTASLVCMGFSVGSMLLLLFIPDSPVWLINKGRTEETIKALQWLRGWVPQRYVMPEFEKLASSVNRTNSYAEDSVNAHNERRRAPSRLSKVLNLLEAATLRPFIFLFLYMNFSYAASLQPTRNYIVDILNKQNLNMDSLWLTFLASVAALVGALVCAATVKVAGKRLLSLTSMISSSIISVLLGLYIAFEPQLQMPSVFVVLFVLLGFTQSFGICTIPWVILGEIFPVREGASVLPKRNCRTRSTATGMTGAAYYISLSVLVKTYHYLELLMTTHGVFIFYGVIGIVGSVFLWIFMPETEGKTMAEIEELFKDDARRSCPHFRKKK